MGSHSCLYFERIKRIREIRGVITQGIVHSVMDLKVFFHSTGKVAFMFRSFFSVGGVIKWVVLMCGIFEISQLGIIRTSAWQMRHSLTFPSFNFLRVGERFGKNCY